MIDAIAIITEPLTGGGFKTSAVSTEQLNTLKINPNINVEGYNIEGVKTIDDYLKKISVKYVSIGEYKIIKKTGLINNSTPYLLWREIVFPNDIDPVRLATDLYLINGYFDNDKIIELCKKIKQYILKTIDENSLQELYMFDIFDAFDFFNDEMNIKPEQDMDPYDFNRCSNKHSAMVSFLGETYDEVESFLHCVWKVIKVLNEKDKIINYIESIDFDVVFGQWW